ncbi:MAG: hypothetical protein MJ159_04850 [Treponemataceae bacterium]|nr:hypothetical protein [Treponemataceae bacterium]
MKTNKLIFLCLFILTTFALSAQKTIELKRPVFSKHGCTDYEDVILKTDGAGRICSLFYGGSFNTEAVINLESKTECIYRDNKPYKERIFTDYELDKTDSSFTFQAVKKENMSISYVFSSGILKEYYYHNDAKPTLAHYYIYKTNDNNYSVSSCEYMQTFNGKREFVDDIDIIEYPVQAINQLKTADKDINTYNARILIWHGFETLIPFLILDEKIISTPKSYKATSELREKNAFYTAENLRTVSGLPWASANGYGIEDKITIELPRHCLLKLDFYNGYQSETRKDLYKANSRAKKIRIKSLESGNSIEVTLKDTPEKQTIPINELNLYDNIYTNLEITILEVYPGDKYKDLCIQAIIPEY